MARRLVASNESPKPEPEVKKPPQKPGVIPIVEGVRLRRADDNNIVIERWRPSEKSSGWHTVGYYPSLLQACEALSTRHLHLLAKEVGTVAQLTATIRELGTTLSRSLSHVKL